MENYDLPTSGVPKGENANVISNPIESHSPIRRELDSVDDFEHLDHESAAHSIQNQAADNEGQLLDFLKSDVPQQLPKTQNFGLMDDLQSFQSDIQDKFASNAHKDPYFSGLDAFTGGGNGGHVSNVIDSTKSFMDFEREPIGSMVNTADFKETKSPDYGFDEPPPATKFDDEDDDDEFDFKDFSKKKDDFIENTKPVLDEFKDFSGTDNMSFVNSALDAALKEPKRDELPKPAEDPKPVFEETKTIIEPAPIVEPKPVPKPAEPQPIESQQDKTAPQTVPEPIREPIPEPPVIKKQDIPLKPPASEPVIPAQADKTVTKPAPKKEEREVIAAEAMFCQMGLGESSLIISIISSCYYFRCFSRIFFYEDISCIHTIHT